MRTTTVPMQNREWLRQFRRLKGYTLHSLSYECGLSHITYISVERGGKRSARPCTVKTLKTVAEKLGIKLDLFYYKTDEDGKLVDKSSITDIFTLFSVNGFRQAIHSEEMIKAIFSPELADYIIENVLLVEQ